MSKQVLTLDLDTGKKKLITILNDESIDEEQKTNQTYDAKTIDKKVDTIGTAIKEVEKSIVDFKDKASYQNCVKEKVSREDEIKDPQDGDRYLVGNEIKVYNLKLKSYETIESKQGMLLVVLKDNNEYYFNGKEWQDRIESDKRIVHISGDETITGQKTFDNNIQVNKNLTVNGDLIVKGKQTQVDTENLIIKDNIVTLNDGEVGSEITKGKSGIEINRGSGKKANLYFDESSKMFKAGLDDEEKIIARIDDENKLSTTETYSAKKIEEKLASLDLTLNLNKDENDTFEVGDVVYVDDSTNNIKKASNNNLNLMNKIVGIVSKKAEKGQKTVKVMNFGEVNISGLSAGKIYFLGVDGKLSNEVPKNKKEFINKLGCAISSDKLLISIGDSIEIV